MLRNDLNASVQHWHAAILNMTAIDSAEGARNCEWALKGHGSASLEAHLAAWVDGNENQWLVGMFFSASGLRPVPIRLFALPSGAVANDHVPEAIVPSGQGPNCGSCHPNFDSPVAIHSRGPGRCCDFPRWIGVVRPERERRLRMPWWLIRLPESVQSQVS